MSENSVVVDRPGNGIGRITLNDPASRNASSPQRSRLLSEAIDVLLGDGDVRAIILTGAGGHFASGGNVKNFGDREPLEILASVRRAQGMLRKVWLAEKPFVAAVEGYAAGAGVGIACMCDIVIGDPGTKFVLPFVRIGMVPDLGLHYSLGLRIGAARARKALLLGESFDATAALGLGLLDEVTEAGGVQARAIAIAEQLARNAPGAMASLRRGFFVASGALDAVLEYEATAMAVHMSGAETKEGVAAFLEKRPPVF